MNFSNRKSAVLVTLFLAVPRVAMAQSDCADQIGELQKNLASFDKEASVLDRGFLKADGLATSLDVAKRSLEGAGASARLSPTWNGLREAADAKNELTAWDERLTNWHDGIVGYQNCMKNPGCSIGALIDERESSNKQLANWLKSLGDEGLVGGTAKAEKAAGMVTNFRAKAGAAATGAIAQTLSCLAEFSPRSSPVSSPEAHVTSPRRAEPVATPAAGQRNPEPAATSSQGYEVGMLDLGPTLGFGGTGFGGSVSIGGRIEKAMKQLDNGILGVSGFVQRWSSDCGLGFGSCDLSTTYLAASVNYHFVLKDHRKWDPFVGLGLGYARISVGGAALGFKVTGDGIGFVGNAGFRYFVTDKMAAYADIGAGAATLNIGLMFKLK